MDRLKSTNNMDMQDLEKINSMKSAKFNFKKDFPTSFSNF